MTRPTVWLLFALVGGGLIAGAAAYIRDAERTKIENEELTDDKETLRRGIEAVPLDFDADDAVRMLRERCERLGLGDCDGTAD